MTFAALIEQLDALGADLRHARKRSENLAEAHQSPAVGFGVSVEALRSAAARAEEMAKDARALAGIDESPGDPA